MVDSRDSVGVEVAPDWIGLVERARDGDAVAVAELFTRFDPLVRSMARGLVAPDGVDDVVQDSWAAAIPMLPRLRTAPAFPAWMRLIVRKQASRYRSDLTAGVVEATEPTDPGDDPAEVAAGRDRVARMRLAMASARDQDRRLLELRYLAGWSNEELADLLGVGAGAVRKRLHDARRRVRPLLTHLEGKESAVTDFLTFLGAVHPADVEVPVAPPLRAAEPAATVTGLKIIDAMAPVRRGGTIEMTGPAGAGQLVLALELLVRTGRSTNAVACVGVGRAGAAVGSQPDLGCLVTEPGIPGPNAVVLAPDPRSTAAAFRAGSNLAAGLASRGLDVVLVIDRPSAESLPAEALANAAGVTGDGAVTVIALTAPDLPDAGSGTGPGVLGFDTTLAFSLELAALGVFPAIDAARSTSTLPVSDAAVVARRLLADAADLRAYFAQPMRLAEDFTGEAGTWVEPEVVEAELRALVG